jgi:RsiW-degrading membrane proteinase PrsW (M82 family)
MRERNVIRSGWLNIACQLLFVALLFAFASATPIPLAGVARAVVLALLVLLPSALWTLFFYLQDRREPEPSRDVLVAFAAGMASASLVAVPAETHLFQAREWMYGSAAVLFLGSTLVRGALATLLFYGTLRHGFVPSPEFDEPVDGLVYGAFVGSGFGAIQSLSYLVAQPQFTLFVVGYTASVNVLVYASVGALVGYFAGRTKFVRGARWRERLLAVALGPVLIGVYHTANELVFLAGWQQAFWLSLALTAGFAIVVLAFVTATMRRLTESAPSRAAGIPRPDLWVFAAFAILLLAGAAVRQVATRPVTFASPRYGIEFLYPPTRLRPTLSSRGRAIGLTLMAPLFTSRGAGPDGVTVSVRAKSERVELSAINPLAYLPPVTPLSLTTGPHEVGGRKGLRVTYAYLKRADVVADALPEVVWGYADIVPGGNYTYTFTFEAPPWRFRQEEVVYRDLLGSVRWTAREG